MINHKQYLATITSYEDKCPLHLNYIRKDGDINTIVYLVGYSILLDSVLANVRPSSLTPNSSSKDCSFVRISMDANTFIKSYKIYDGEI